MSKSFPLDPYHESFKWHNDPICEDVWRLKYRRRDEESIFASIDRVVSAICEPRTIESTRSVIYDGVFLPGGRILAGAGLDEHDSTLMNCYVMGELDDSLDGIMKCLHESAITTKFGGGIGVNFGSLRPKGATVSTAAYFAGGPVAFMGMWDAMGHALEAGGNRRGGKMAVMPVHHPDILEFIEAKSKGGKLTSFNISIGISDEFMKGVKLGGLWQLHSIHPRKGEELTQKKIGAHYIWAEIPARELWERILRHTYEYSEPGIMFMDRLNDWNNLQYCETIYATNPCGEQPLPPYGACNLGSINLARLVIQPFTPNAHINWPVLRDATAVAVQFLDAVLDKTKYPLEQQQVESMHKRRIGLGITGLADMIAQLNVGYGTADGLSIADRVMKTITQYAYAASAELAKLRGPFPLWNEEKFLDSDFCSELPAPVIKLIRENGLRNGVLLSIAPTGTISTVFGDVSSGCEPTFAHKQIRKIKVKDANNDDTWQPYTSYSFTVRFYAHVKGLSLEDAYDAIKRSPQFFPTAGMLSVEQHIDMQGVLQRSVDSSISKTTNVPSDMPFEDFMKVYDYAYAKGCKGTTTYRPSEVRGAVLIDADSKPKDEQAPEVVAVPLQQSHGSAPLVDEPPVELGINYKRPDVLNGTTYKLRWPHLVSPVFLTINFLNDGRPVELFVSSKDASHHEWTIALSVFASKLLQMGTPAHYVAAQLKEITLSHSPAWVGGKHYGSLVSWIGHLLEGHNGHKAPLQLAAPIKTEEKSTPAVGKRCNRCGSLNVIVKEGCASCNDCNHSNCH